MKTAISVPDPIFERVEQHAKRLGVSRSAFFAEAAKRYVDQLDDHDLTERINAALDKIGDAAYEDLEFVMEAARRTFERVEWDVDPAR